MVNNQGQRRAPSGSEQREAAIIEAAVHGFTLQGFHATSTRAIATQAGVSEGTLFNYFVSKYDLLLAILERFYQDLEQSAREGVEGVLDTRQRLQVLAANHVRALVENQAVMSRLIQVYLSVNLDYYTDYRRSHLHQLNYRYTRVFDNVIREGIERGVIRRDIDLPALRDLFFGGLEYGARTAQNGARALSHIHAIVEPLWQSMQSAAEAGPQDGEASWESRLASACERVERLAERLQGRG